MVDTTLTQKEVRYPRAMELKLEEYAAVIAAVPAVTVSAEDGADGTAGITVQVNDQNGTAVAYNCLVRLWLADTVMTAPDATNKTAFAVGTGVELEEVTAQGDYRLLTDATGTLVATLTAADGTYYVMVEVDGKVSSAEITVTGN